MMAELQTKKGESNLQSKGEKVVPVVATMDDRDNGWFIYFLIPSAPVECVAPSVFQP